MQVLVARECVANTVKKRTADTYAVTPNEQHVVRKRHCGT
jgi:hypothetical protein